VNLGNATAFFFTCDPIMVISLLRKESVSCPVFGGEVLALVMSNLCFGIGSFGGDHSLESGALSCSGCV